MDLFTLKATKQFAQLLLPNANAVAILNKAAKRKVVLTSILLVNSTANAATAALYLDANGTAANGTSAILPTTVINANSYVYLEPTYGFPFNAETAGRLTAQANAANTITVTVNGIEG